MSEPMCPNHPDRKATMPTPKGKRCVECFFEQRKAKQRKAVIVVEGAKQ